MAELLLIVRLAGRRVAFPASEVEGVVELEGLTPAPGAAPHVAGLSSLRSRVLTVIDAAAALELGKTAEGNLACAVVIPSGGHPYALLLDGVEDVVEASGACGPVSAPLGPGWDRVALGAIEVGEDVLLFVDPHALIAGTAAIHA